MTAAPSRAWAPAPQVYCVGTRGVQGGLRKVRSPHVTGQSHGRGSVTGGWAAGQILPDPSRQGPTDLDRGGSRARPSVCWPMARIGAAPARGDARDRRLTKPRDPVPAASRSAPSVHRQADGDPTTPDVERAAAARARRTLIHRDRVFGCWCRCGPEAGGGRRSAAEAGQHRGPDRHLHWLTLPAPAATHWPLRCTIVASRAKGRGAQRGPRKTSEKLKGAGVERERGRGWGGAWRAGHDGGGASPGSRPELGMCGPSIWPQEWAPSRASNVAVFAL